jgi:hypothetical protein
MGKIEDLQPLRRCTAYGIEGSVVRMSIMPDRIWMLADGETIPVSIPLSDIEPANPDVAESQP